MEVSRTDSNQMQLDILARFPLLVPRSTDFRSYEGFVEAKNIPFGLSLEVPYYPSSKDMVLSCEWKLSELLSSQKHIISQWISQQVPLLTFLEELHKLISSCLENGGSSRLCLEGDSSTLDEQVDNLQHCSTVLSELKEIGTDNLVYLSSDFRSLTLSSTDSSGELHSLKLKFSSARENARKSYFDVFDTDLPDAIVKMIQKDGSITKAFGIFCEQIEVLQPIWNSLSMIDQQCWVIDPIHPRKADMYRRIYITPPSVMAQMSWDPLKPRQPPEIKFQGADAEIDAIRCTYEEHLEDWHQECDILDNLCTVLKLSSLPQPPPPTETSVSQTVETGECSICYQVQAEGKLPDEACGKCLSSFHTACLYEWLEMMPGSRQVHGHVSGPCPYCETTMKCPCPHTVP